MKQWNVPLLHSLLTGVQGKRAGRFGTIGFVTHSLLVSYERGGSKPLSEDAVFRG